MTTRDIQIKNYSGWFERAEAIILARAGCGTAFVSQQVSQHKLPASRIDYLFIKGPAGEISLNDEQDEVEDDIQGRIIFTLSTKREKTQQSLIDGVKTLHEDWAARIRAAHEFKENPFKDLLPFYTVLQTREGQNDRDLDLNFWVDYTRIPIDVRFSVNSNAWSIPASALTIPAA